MPVEDDSGSLTFGIRAEDNFIILKSIKMEFNMIPSFVHREEVIESNLAWLSSIPEAEDALSYCRSLREWSAV